MQRPLALVLWYAAQTGSATLSPWLSSLLSDAGWSTAAVTAILVTVPIGRLLGGPLWSWVADRSSADRILRIAAVSSFVAAGFLALTTTVPAAGAFVALAIVAYGVARSPLFSIMDASTVHWVGERYGRIRAVGSVAFLVLVWLGGYLRPSWPLAPLWLAVGAIGIATAVTFALPALPARAPRRPGWSDVIELARHRPLVMLVIISVLQGVALSSYDQLFAMHIDQLGLPPWVTGTSFALGVLVEIGILYGGSWLLHRLGRRGVLLLGVAAGVPRFLLTAVTTDAWGLVAIQSFHGLQYGAFWVAATSAFAAEAPPELRNSTQALLPSAAYGAGPVIGMTLAWVGLQFGGSLPLHYALVAGVSMVATGLVWRLELSGRALDPAGD
ncbi:MAG: MFS transporter [Myxococcota bacterium]